MKSSGILVASMLLFAGTGIAQDRPSQDFRVAHPPPLAEESTRYSWADVLRVDPIYDANTVDTAPPDNGGQMDCTDLPPPAPPAPQPQREGQGDNRAAGTIVGALIGGVVGHAFGRGDGRKATTAAGVVAGGVIGNQVAASGDRRSGSDSAPQTASGDEERDAVAASLRDCRHQAPPPERRIVGYDVEYRYRGEIYMARLPYDPGDRMRVKVSVTPAD